MTNPAPREFSPRALARILTDVLAPRTTTAPASAAPRRPRTALVSQGEVVSQAVAFREAVEFELLTRKLQQNRAVNCPELEDLLGRLTGKTARGQ